MVITGVIFAVEMKFNLFWNPYMTENRSHNYSNGFTLVSFRRIRKKLILISAMLGHQIVKNYEVFLCLYKLSLFWLSNITYYPFTIIKRNQAHTNGKYSFFCPQEVHGTDLTGLTHMSCMKKVSLFQMFTTIALSVKFSSMVSSNWFIFLTQVRTIQV